MFDPKRYSICIRLETEDEVDSYIGTVNEIPDLLVCEDTYADAYAATVSLIEDLHDIAIEAKRPFPKPAPQRIEVEYSGRITLRIGKALHRTISKLAEDDYVSLNSWIGEAIATRAATAVTTQTLSTKPWVAHTFTKAIDHSVKWHISDAIHFAIQSIGNQEVKTIQANTPYSGLVTQPKESRLNIGQQYSIVSTHH